MRESLRTVFVMVDRVIPDAAPSQSDFPSIPRMRREEKDRAMPPRRDRPSRTNRILLWSAVLLLIGLAPRVQAQESWDAVFLSGSKIGYIHTFVEKVTDKGRDLLRVRVDMVLSFKREQDTVVNEMMYGTIETPEGEVLRIATRTLLSDRELKMSGDVNNGQMRIKVEGGSQREQIIPWGPDIRGPYAAEQSLARKPPTEGELRQLRMFIPELNKVCDVVLKAKPIEEVVLGDGSKRGLRRIEQAVSLDGKPRPEFSLTFWIDQNGQVLKQEQDILGGMVTYRTTKQGATAPNGSSKFDQISNSVARTKSRISNPEQTRYVKYRISLKDEDPAQIFPTDRRQTIQKGDTPNSIILEVRTAGPNDGEAGSLEIDAEFLRPNALISSEDSRVRACATRAVAGASDPWEKASRINRWVFESIQDKNFGTTFASASEVARNLSGDCTEHAVLSAAMCRASGVPSRVVVGLVYVPKLSGFGYHMWNEVYINQRWVALDPSFDETSVDAVHIKLSEASLDGISPFESFLPVARILGKLEIEPLELK
jgi:transglutaminase-like putative cysteine protease